MENWLSLIVSILSGLAITIPLVIKLVEYVKMAIKEKNWSQLVDLIVAYVAEAEEKFDDGATRKEWVMAMIETSAKSINYDVDMDVVSSMIDNLCKMAKVVNVKKDDAQIINPAL